MTDRHAGYVVTLAKDLREDDAQHLITALWQLRGVIDVQPHITDVNLHIASVRADTAWRNKLLDFVADYSGPRPEAP